MTKHLYILLLIIFFSVKETKSSKNLRNLATSLTFTSAQNLVYRESKLTFDITIGETTELNSADEYKLTILIKNDQPKEAKCKYINNDGTHKLNCEYEPDKPYYGFIQLPESSDDLNDDISLGINSPQTLQQEVILKYKESNI